MKTLLETLNNQPHQLTAEEVACPEKAMAHFFNFHELHITRARLLAFYQAWLNDHAANPQSETLTEMLFFFNSLIDLVNASYVVSYRYQPQ
ncbi:hypothetical protein D9M68_608220 [compost metagenome]